MTHPSTAMPGRAAPHRRRSSHATSIGWFPDVRRHPSSLHIHHGELLKLNSRAGRHGRRRRCGRPKQLDVSAWRGRNAIRVAIRGGKRAAYRHGTRRHGGCRNVYLRDRRHGRRVGRVGTGSYGSWVIRSVAAAGEWIAVPSGGALNAASVRVSECGIVGKRVVVIVVATRSGNGVRTCDSDIRFVDRHYDFASCRDHRTSAIRRGKGFSKDDRDILFRSLHWTWRRWWWWRGGRC
mmetsp:Transcript_20653/g.31569  ORF Transcript_20653/g.31569 Transcript_20653/m.31569 type:complete len:236 (-) Transcript_20653:85-792(-)